MSEGSRLSLRRRISWQTRHGRRLVVGDVALTPVSRALQIAWSGGGLVWNRPTAVLVERDGQVERLPIVDVTRRAQLFLAGLGLLFWLTAATLRKRQNDG